MKRLFPERNPNHIRDQQGLFAWLMSAPALILIIAFFLIPFFMSVYYSFTDKMLASPPGTTVQFKGLDNYIKLFQSDAVKNAFINTTKYVLIVVPFIMILATLLAIFVNEKLRGIGIFRTIYFSPQVVTMTVVAVVWSFIFSPSNDGMLNSILNLLRIEPQRWLKDPKLALLCIAIMYIWQALGLQMVIVLGGLQYIPEDLYEAAKLDGCNALQRTLYITLPCLKNTLVYVLVSNTISAMKIFTQVFVLTQGGPNGSTTTMVYQIYQSGFTDKQLAFSSAISVVFFLVVFAISKIQNYLLERGE